MASSQTTGPNPTNAQPVAPSSAGVMGAAKYGAVGVLGFLAGVGTLWSFTSREPSPVAAVQQPAPIIVQPPQVVIQMPAQPSQPAPVTPSPTAPPMSSPDTSLMGPPVSSDGGGDEGAAPRANAPTPTVATPPAAPVVVTPKPVSAPAGRLNINTATVDQIQSLPGIGPALAGRIMAYRAAHGPFTSLADLDKVEGIGPKTLERLAPLITVGD